MSKRHPSWHLRVTFEPSRFASEQLAKVYERLKPTESREFMDLPEQKQIAKKGRKHIKGGEQ
jgi:hypothetical protein